jgi:2-aminoethylphosphonate-pyruvate transaminase
MPRQPDDLLLLTPGPVSVSRSTKAVMMVDRPSGDVEFQADLAHIREYLVALANGIGTYTAIPLPGSSTYANEAAIALLVPPECKLLVHTNGVYGDRLIEICEALGTAVAVLRTDPFTPPTPDQFEAMLLADPAISHVMIVHCETSTGVLNPLEEVAALCRQHGKGLLVDAVASFGAIEIDASALAIDAVMLSSNKCMQGVPGVGWAVVRTAAIESATPLRRSLSLDLREQSRHMDTTGLFRFTPPTQVVMAFAQACREHAAEGGVTARHARYRRNWQRLVDGMRQMGFRTVVPDANASPIVATFHNPDDPAFSFQQLFEGMKRRGFVIFPGRLALANTFRIGCMGEVTEDDIGEAMTAVSETMAEMGVHGFGHAEMSAGN